MLEDFIQNIEKAKVMQESYDKRLNILIHGIRENSNNAWEKREETIAKFKNFLKNGLKMDDTEDVEYVYIYRLPQHPVKKNGKTVDRPIIVKLLTTHDKKLIFEAVRNLKAYNTKLKREDETSPSVYVTEHLPKNSKSNESFFYHFTERRRKIKKKRYGNQSMVIIRCL